ncbi:hypothetical protein ABK040_010746 [Willaertia magna]
MLPHIYQGHIPTYQQEIVKTKLDDYSNHQLNYILKHEENFKKKLNNNTSLNNSKISINGNLQQTILPNKNKFINKNINDSTNGDFKIISSNYFPKQVTTQNVEENKRLKIKKELNELENKRNEITKERNYLQSSINLEIYNNNNLQKNNTLQQNEKVFNRVKSQIVNDFKVSKNVYNIPSKNNNTINSNHLNKSQDFPKSSYQIDYNYCNNKNLRNSFTTAINHNSNKQENICSTTLDIEGINNNERMMIGVIGYSGHVPIMSNNNNLTRNIKSAIIRPGTCPTTTTITNNNNGSINKRSNSAFVKQQRKVDDNNNNTLYKNDGSIKFNRCNTFYTQSHLDENHHVPGYQGFNPQSFKYDTFSRNKITIQQLQVYAKCNQIAGNVTKEKYMVGWEKKADGLLDSIYRGKDKSHYKQSTMVNDFFTNNAGDFMESDNGKVGAALFFARR